MVTTAALRASAELPWAAAISHRFLDAVADGSIQRGQFDVWLAQDRLFVQRFTRLAGSLLRVAPLHHQDLLLGGLGALKDELLWFEAQAAVRGVDLTAPHNALMHRSCAAYCEWMATLHSQPLVVQATAFWAIEHVYNAAWRRIAPAAAHGPYAQYTARWGSDGFTEYVGGLAAMADGLLAVASDEDAAAAVAAVRRVLELEVAFWDMAYF